MDPHEYWHLVVLASSLLGAAGLALVLLAPLLFEDRPPGLTAARRVVIGLVAIAAALFVWEWRFVH